MSSPYLFRRADWRLLNRDDLGESRFWFASACAASRAHSTLSHHALVAFGDDGAEVSGCVRDHFPDAIKGELRALAAKVRDHGSLAYQAAPKRVRDATLSRLGRLIATRDGAGFYGPQPLRGDV